LSDYKNTGFSSLSKTVGTNIEPIVSNNFTTSKDLSLDKKNLYLKNENLATHTTVTCTKENDESIQLVTYNENKLKIALLATLQKSSPLTTKQLVKELKPTFGDIRKSHINPVLYKLFNTGAIKKIDDACWSI